MLDDGCEGNNDCLAEYQKAKDAANKSIIDFIKENGADVLLDIIGVNEAKKCFGQCDVAACLWTFINAASLAALFLKLPELGAATVKVGASLDKFLGASAAGAKVVEASQGAINAITACMLRS